MIDGFCQKVQEAINEAPTSTVAEELQRILDRCRTRVKDEGGVTASSTDDGSSGGGPKTPPPPPPAE